MLWTYTAGAGVDVGATCSFASATAIDTTIACTDDGTYTATLTATDSFGATSSDPATVTVANANPITTALNPVLGPLAKPATVSVSAGFTDAGRNDVHICTISWDDGTANSTGTVTEPVGPYSGSCSSSGHAFSAAGVYTVTLTVIDDDGGSGTASIMVIVYDPSAGFVTGGGWIQTNQSMYFGTPNLLSGCPTSGLTATQLAQCKGHFGFVSKYQKGALIPTGETEFQLQTVGFKFQSTSYDWLVVNGGSGRAQYKGVGKVNGAGSYGFLLTAYDGGTSGDKFRIKIWDKSNGDVVVFDNRPLASTDMDTADPQPIGQGSIVIHTTNGK